MHRNVAILQRIQKSRLHPFFVFEPMTRPYGPALFGLLAQFYVFRNLDLEVLVFSKTIFKPLQVLMKTFSKTVLENIYKETPL